MKKNNNSQIAAFSYLTIIFTTRVASFFSVIAVYFIATSVFANNNSINFPNACAQGDSLTIAAVGDVLLHTPLQEKGSKNGFTSLWQEAISFIQEADIAYANLEGPISPGMKRKGENTVYSSFPYFNYRPMLAYDLKKTGFDIVSTANNHALDRFSIGVDKTIETLDKAGLAHVGTKSRGSSQGWLQIINKNNFKIAWIACTETTNGNPDVHHQVLRCYTKNDRKLILKMISNLKNKVDAIIISPHWGEEYQTRPNGGQIYFAHQVLEAGATAVIGSHPHVLQPLQKYTTKDGRATIILYSLGNFVSYQGQAVTRSTIILLLGLTKTAQGTIINGVRFVPMYMQNRSGQSNIRLTCMPFGKRDVQSYGVISRVMPMANALYAKPIVTNPQCQLKKVEKNELELVPPTRLPDKSI